MPYCEEYQEIPAGEKTKSYSVISSSSIRSRNRAREISRGLSLTSIYFIRFLTTWIMVDKFKPMHLFVDFHVGPSKEYLIFFLCYVIDMAYILRVPAGRK